MTEGNRQSPAAFYWPELHQPATLPLPGYWSDYAGVINGLNLPISAQHQICLVQQKAAPSAATGRHSVNIRQKCLIQSVV